MSKYISWRELQRTSVKAVREWLKAGEIWVTVDGDTAFRLVVVGPQNDSQSMAALRNGQPISGVASRAIDSQSGLASDEKQVNSGLASSPVDSQGRLSSIPGVRRGYLVAGSGAAVPLQIVQERPEPEIIEAERYVRGKRYAAGTRVSRWNPATKQTEILIAPEVDAEGNQVW